MYCFRASKFSPEGQLLLEEPKGGHEFLQDRLHVNSTSFFFFYTLSFSSPRLI